MKDRIRVIGRIATLRETDKPSGAGWKRDPRTGLYTRRSFSKNMVVLAGLSMMAKSIQYGNADAGATIRYLETGTGFTVPAKSQTALVAAVLRAEIDSWDNTNIAADPVVMIATKLFTTAQSNGDLMECGLFKASSGAPMFSRGLFGLGNISGATQTDPVVVTAYSHGLTDGDKIYVENVDGMTEINDTAFFVNVLTTHTFELYTDSALTASVDGTGYGAYSEASPGNDTWKLVIPKTASETLTVTYSLTFPAD